MYPVQDGPEHPQNGRSAGSRFALPMVNSGTTGAPGSELQNHPFIPISHQGLSAQQGQQIRASERTVPKGVVASMEPSWRLTLPSFVGRREVE